MNSKKFTSVAPTLNWKKETIKSISIPCYQLYLALAVQLLLCCNDLLNFAQLVSTLEIIPTVKDVVE